MNAFRYFAVRSSPEHSERSTWRTACLTIKLLSCWKKSEICKKCTVENYKDALKNQEESIDLQRRAVRRQRTTLLVFGLLLLIFLLFLALSSHR
jgi:hypothetical protein